MPLYPPPWAVKLGQSGAGIQNPVNTSENTLVTMTLPANALGPNGHLYVHIVVANNATTPIWRIKLGGTVFFQITSAFNDANYLAHTSNRGVTNQQLVFSPGADTTGFGSTSIASSNIAVDTTVSQNVIITAQNASSSASMYLNAYLAWYVPG